MLSEFIYTLNGPDTKSRGLPPKILGQGELSTSTLCDLLERNILSYSVTKQNSPATGSSALTPGKICKETAQDTYKRHGSCPARRITGEDSTSKL